VTNPLLTVVTVSFNAGDAFATTLSSVRAQTLRSRIEYLVVDGASTDGTMAMIEEAAGRGEVDGWFSEPDRGIYDAMNKGVARATGDYVLFLNAGDAFPSADTLERFLALGTDRPDFVWGDCEIVIGGRFVPDPAGRMLRFLYRQMTVSHQSLAIRTDRLRAHPFDLTLKVAADYEVLCSLVSSGARGLYLPVVVSRIEEEGFSSRNFFLGLAEKRAVSFRYFPAQRWRSAPYFALWGLYMKLKFWYKERS